MFLPKWDVLKVQSLDQKRAALKPNKNDYEDINKAQTDGSGAWNTEFWDCVEWAVHFPSTILNPSEALIQKTDWVWLFNEMDVQSKKIHNVWPCPSVQCFWHIFLDDKLLPSKSRHPNPSWNWFDSFNSKFVILMKGSWIFMHQKVLSSTKNIYLSTKNNTLHKSFYTVKLKFSFCSLLMSSKQKFWTFHEITLIEFILIWSKTSKI